MVEVKLGRPTLEDVVEAGAGQAWIEIEPGPKGGVSSGGHEEEWVEVTVGVELQPWPDRHWLAFWQEADLDWPDRLETPVLDGRKLIFDAREEELEEAWAAVKARVDAANRMYREEFAMFAQADEEEPHPAEPEAFARLRERVQRRIDALE